MYSKLKLNFIIIFLAYLIQVTICLPNIWSNYDSEIILEYATDKGQSEWGRSKWQYCEKGYFVTGLKGQFITAPHKSYNKRILQGLKIFCGLAGTTKVVNTLGFHNKHLKNKEKFWTPNHFCEGPATGFQLKSSGKFKLKTVANLRLICSNFNESIQPDIISGKDDNKNWLNKQVCHSDQGICGIQFSTFKSKKFKFDHENEGSSEENIHLTGMENIRFKCCNFKDEADYCTPYEKREILFRYNNFDGLQPASYSYTKRVGISYTIGKIEVRSVELNGTTFGNSSIGVDIGGTAVKLSEKFEYLAGVQKTKNQEWSFATSDTFEKEKSSQVSVEIRPGYITEIWQIIGVCGGFTIRPDKIFQTGYFSQDKLNESQRLGYQRISMKDKLILMVGTLAFMAMFATFS